MGTECFIVCDDHMLVCAAISERADGTCCLSPNAIVSMALFLRQHRDCKLRVVDKWADEVLGLYTEWEE